MIGVLHTTESAPGSFQAVAAYFTRNPGIQPHVLLDPETQSVQKFLPVGEPAKALRNLTGGVETNRLDIDGQPGADLFQVEVVGYAAECGSYAPAWYEWLAAQLYAMSAFLDIPWTFRPADAGRMSPEEWVGAEGRAYGWIGHRDVPENDHTDPGTLDLDRLAAYAAPAPAAVHSTVAQENTTMDTTTRLTDGTNINDRLLWTGDAVKRIEEDHLPALKVDIDAVKNTVQALITVTQAQSAQAQRPLGIDYDLLAGKVADVIANRLRS